MAGSTTQAPLACPMRFAYLPATARVAVTQIGRAAPGSPHSPVRYRGGSARHPTETAGSCGQASVSATEKLKAPAAPRGPLTAHTIIRMESQL
jgi:hypothetical protein